MKDSSVYYNSCEYYARKGNEVAKEYLQKTFGYKDDMFVYPEDNHSVYDLQINHPKKTIYIEVKLKMDGRFFEDNTFITHKKVGEIEEFMKGKDRDNVMFLYMNFYPFKSKMVLFNMTNAKQEDFPTKIIHNRNSTANETDIEAYEMDVLMSLLPMQDKKFCKIINHSTDVEIEFNHRTWKNGRVAV